MCRTPFFFKRKDRRDKEGEGVIYQHNVKNKFIQLFGFSQWSARPSLAI